MRFMFIVKSAHVGPPPPALMEAMHKLADREIKAGRMLDSGGLIGVCTSPLTLLCMIVAASCAVSARRY